MPAACAGRSWSCTRSRRAGSARRPAWASRSRAATDRPWPRRSGLRSAWIPSGRWPSTSRSTRGSAAAGWRWRISSPAARLVRDTPGLVLGGVWTHFQAVEDAAITAAQIAGFEAAVEDFASAGIDLPPRHVAASAALLTDGIVAYDGVRPGLAIYGLVPDELEPSALSARAAGRLRPVLSLHARPVRVADLPAGHGISYGPTFRTARPSRIATLPLGYGDGWSRALSNRAGAIVRGRLVPLVGNVAMDAVMADVTDVPGRPVDTSDEFTLIGRSGAVRIGVQEVGQVRTTNSWEVVTGMSRRLPRVYHAAAGPVGLRTLTERRG